MCGLFWLVRVSKRFCLFSGINGVGVFLYFRSFISPVVLCSDAQKILCTITRHFRQFLIWEKLFLEQISIYLLCGVGYSTAGSVITLKCGRNSAVELDGGMQQVASERWEDLAEGARRQAWISRKRGFAWFFSGEARFATSRLIKQRLEVSFIFGVRIFGFQLHLTTWG